MKIRYLLLILLLGFLLRFMDISNAPPAIMPDEIDYALSAKSVAYFGKDLSLSQNILDLQPFKTETAMAELGPLFQVPTMAFFPTSLVTAKVMPIFFSCLFVLGVYLLVKKLFLDPNMALYSSFIVAVNPWSIFIGRTGYEAPIALSLFTFSFFMLVNFFQVLNKPFKKWLSVKPALYFFCWYALFFFAFFTYHGTKIPGLGLTLLLTGYLIWKNKSKKNIFSGLLILCLSLSTFFVNTYTLIKQQTRTNEISVFNLETYANEAGKQKRLNFNSNSFVSTLIDSRYGIWLFTFITNIASAYNLQDLFLSGAKGWTAGLVGFGQFYFFEFVFLFVGIYYLLKNRKVPELILFLLSLLTVVFSFALKITLAYISLQACLMILIFVIVMSYGLKCFFETLKNINTKRLIGFCLFFLYSLSLIGWGHNYFNRFPLYAEEQFNFKDRLLSKYLSLLENNQRSAVIMVPNPYGTFRNFIFYNNLYTRDTAKELALLLTNNQGNKSFKNFTFSNDCSYLKNVPTNTTIIISSSMNKECFSGKTSKKQEPIHMTAIKDSGSNYQIYEDVMCDSKKLKGFLFIQDKRAFNVERMKQDEFCQKWLIKYFNQ